MKNSSINKYPLSVKQLTTFAMLAALAFVLSFLESLIPFQPGLPGIKLGLANLVVVFALFRMDTRAALFINAVRILLAGFLFSGPFGMLYSAAGAAASLASMSLLLRINRKRKQAGKSDLFSILGVSMTGGVFLLLPCHDPLRYHNRTDQRNDCPPAHSGASKLISSKVTLFLS